MSAVIRALSHPGEGACNQIVDKGNTLSTDAARTRRQQQVIVNECWAVGYLHKDIDVYKRQATGLR